MDTPRGKAQRDQELAEAVDRAPRIYLALYLGFVNEGFTQEQARRLLIAIIHRPSAE